MQGPHSSRRPNRDTYTEPPKPTLEARVAALEERSTWSESIIGSILYRMGVESTAIEKWRVYASRMMLGWSHRRWPLMAILNQIPKARPRPIAPAELLEERFRIFCMARLGAKYDPKRRFVYTNCKGPPTGNFVERHSVSTLEIYVRDDEIIGDCGDHHLGYDLKERNF